MSRLQLAQKELKKKELEIAARLQGACLLTLCCPQSCWAVGTGPNDQVSHLTLQTRPTGARGHSGRDSPATSLGQHYLSWRLSRGLWSQG